MTRKQLRSQKIVTDHALVRWMERVQGLDADALRDHILSPELEKALKMGAKKFRAGGIEYVLGDGKIITVVEAR